MFFIKILVGIASLVICVKIGTQKASKKKAGKEFFDDLVRLCDRFLSELEYGKSTVEKVIKSATISNDLKTALLNSSKSEEVVLPEYLSQSEKDEIISFFRLIGVSGTQSQKQAFNGYREVFVKRADEKNIEFKKFYNLFIKLGFMAGLALFIMVV